MKWRSVQTPRGGALWQHGRFRAIYHEQKPTVPGQDYVILDRSDGQGLYLGHCLIVEPQVPENTKWWEGDLRIRIDQRSDPIYNGTGHEDEFLGGWSSRWLAGPYTLPLHGLPAVVLLNTPPGQQKNGAITAYRFFAGGIPFRSGIRVSTEHGTENSVVVNYSSVAYWYDGGRPTMHVTDGLDVGVPASERAHAYVVQGGQWTGETTAQFESGGGRPARMMRNAGWRGQTAERFVFQIDPRNHGILLRRLYLQSSGRQRARLLVDGQSAGYMGTPDDNRVDRWRQEDIILPAALTMGRSRLAIELQVEAGEWNSFGYTAWVLAPPGEPPPPIGVGP